jgi:choline-sulfatase
MNSGLMQSTAHTVPCRTINVPCRILLFLGCLVTPPTASVAEEPSRPNVLFIAIDDLNDWLGCLEGHPLAKTPHMDQLARRGTLLTNAHCQSPLCNPSRTSLLLGLRPSTTGIHGLEPWFRRVPQWQDHVTLPQHFARHGYRTLSAGKIYHSLRNEPPRSRPPEGKAEPEFHVWGPAGGIGTRPPEKLIPPTPSGNHPLMDWGVWPLDNDDSEKGDYQVASWAVEQLETLPKEEPFFLAVGFFLPHVPCYATQQWFDLYPDDDSVLPPVLESDRDDTPRFSWYLHWDLPEPRLDWVREAGQWRNLVRSYLACTSFVDHQVGRVLEALEKSPHADNTIVVVWSDHGWHLGEKMITGKNSLWDRSTRVPLLFAGPGVTPNQKCNQPAELLDLFPTLIELCQLQPLDYLEGRSLVPQLTDAATPRTEPAITSHNQGNFSVRTERWRYIRYADGSEELYDMENDPDEWQNLAAERRGICAELARAIPRIDAGPAPGSAHRILTLYDRQPVWEGKPIVDDAAPP